MSDDEVMAATRDASWYRNPRNGLRDQGALDWVPVYHVLADNGAGPACNPEGALLSDANEMPATEVPVRARCKRRGCQARWPS